MVSIFRIVLVGAKLAGKTCLLRRYVESTFDAESAPTVGIDLFMVSYCRDESSDQIMICFFFIDEQVPLQKPGNFVQFVDVSHAELHGSHLKSIFSQAAAIILVLLCCFCATPQLTSKFRLPT